MREVPTFSIIIPTYNVEPYIARCLDSCINQTFGDIEIIVVDDCGSDDSVRIAQTYALKDSRISIVHNKRNLGTLHSRLEGIKYARGTYILFVDADDYLIPNACETLYPYLAKNPDIIHFKAFYQGDKNASLLANITHKARYILPNQWSKAPLRDSQIAYNFFLKSKHFPKFTIWDKCYSMELLRESLAYLQHITAPICIVDDMVLFFVISHLAQNYTSTRKRLVCYCLNQTSMSQDSQKTHRRIDEMRNAIKAFEFLSKIFEAHNSKQIAHTLSEHLRALIVLESRFDSCVGTKGGGNAGLCPESSTPAKSAIAVAQVLAQNFTMSIAIAVFVCLYRFSKILESLSDLCAHCRLYPKLWQNQTLTYRPSHTLNSLPLIYGRSA